MSFDRSVREVWERLAEAGLPSLALNTHPGHRPHLTLAAAGRFPDGALDKVGLLLREPALPLPVRLTGLLSFSARSRRRILVWAVVPSAELIGLHAEVWRALDGVVEPNPLYEPGRWIPHMGLTRRLESDQVITAMQVLGRLPDLSGALSEARSFDSDSQQAVPLGAD
jgi:2'-5' RNA ligase